MSARYLPPGVYGAEELDYYGHWRVVPTYGSVWIPYGVSVGWVPYSTGYWAWDPYYTWTWIDDAPWGWAPFHYGRWVYFDGYWAWAPRPVVRRPVYSPALVAFMIRDGGVSVRLSVALPGLWWVALSWGEPLLPWWGPPHYRGRPWWGGWGGPRIVNNVVIKQTTVVNIDAIRYHNATLPRAILIVPADKFGRERVRATVENRYRHTEFAPVRRASGQAYPRQPVRRGAQGGAAPARRRRATRGVDSYAARADSRPAGRDPACPPGGPGIPLRDSARPPQRGQTGPAAPCLRCGGGAGAGAAAAAAAL